MSEFEKDVNIDLLAPVPGESTLEKVTRMARYIANCNTFTRETGIKTLVGVQKILESWNLEELEMFREMEWAHDSISDHWYHSIKTSVNDLIYVRQQGWTVERNLEYQQKQAGQRAE
jgi:hypothetical protein